MPTSGGRSRCASHRLPERIYGSLPVLIGFYEHMAYAILIGSHSAARLVPSCERGFPLAALGARFGSASVHTPQAVPFYTGYFIIVLPVGEV